MYEAHGIIRDYDQATNTATVELVGIGVIDTWISGLKVHQGILPGTLASGANVTVQMPDAHRICEATIVNLWDPFQTTATGAGTSKIQTGRHVVSFDGAGNGSITITFPVAYTSAAPTVACSVDGRTTPVITSVTLTTFTATFTGPPNGDGTITWYATGV